MLIKYVAIPVSERIALEGRIYRKVPIHRLMYLYDNRKWWNVSAVLLLERIYLFVEFYYSWRDNQEIFILPDIIYNCRKSRYFGTQGC